MTGATIIMIVLICVGCALLLAGLAVAGIQAYRLTKAARQAGISSKADLEEVKRRMRSVEVRAREVQRRQEVVAEGLKRLSATTSQLAYLKTEYDRSIGRLFRLKS